MNIFLNGKILTLNKTEEDIFNSGLLRGYGVFETMRAYKGNIVYLDAHLRRFARSANILRMKIPYSTIRLKKIILNLAKQHGFSDLSVKLLAYAKESKTNIGLITKQYNAWPQKKYARGFDISISGFHFNPDIRFAPAKTISRALFELAYRKAKMSGFDETLLINNQGYIVEASRSNIFLVKRKKIFTPSIGCGCLEGITRTAVLQLARKNRIEAIEKKIKAEEIFKADAVILTNSLMGIMPVGSCNKRKIKYPDGGALVKVLMSDYDKILKGRSHA